MRPGILRQRVLAREVELERVLRPSGERVLAEKPPVNTDQSLVLRVLYAEVCNSWRALVEVRFKLLGLVPADLRDRTRNASAA
jgi:hypothetical protein